MLSTSETETLKWEWAVGLPIPDAEARRSYDSQGLGFLPAEGEEFILYLDFFSGALWRLYCKYSHQ